MIYAAIPYSADYGSEGLSRRLCLLRQANEQISDAAQEVQHHQNQPQKDEEPGAAALQALELRGPLVALDLGRDQSEMHIGHFVIGDGRTGDHLLQAVRRGVNADLRKAPAQPPRLSAAKALVSAFTRELAPFVGPGVRRGRHKPGV